MVVCVRVLPLLLCATLCSVPMKKFQQQLASRSNWRQRRSSQLPGPLVYLGVKGEMCNGDAP